MILARMWADVALGCHGWRGPSNYGSDSLGAPIFIGQQEVCPEWRPGSLAKHEANHGGSIETFKLRDLANLSPDHTGSLHAMPTRHENLLVSEKAYSIVWQNRLAAPIDGFSSRPPNMLGTCSYARISAGVVLV